MGLQKVDLYRQTGGCLMKVTADTCLTVIEDYILINFLFEAVKLSKETHCLKIFNNWPNTKMHDCARNYFKCMLSKQALNTIGFNKILHIV